MPPPPQPRKKNHAPPCRWPPFWEKRILAWAIGKGGGDGKTFFELFVDI